LPPTPYFLSVSRGDSIRTAMLTPAGLWALLALTLLSFAFGFAGAADLVFRESGVLAGRSEAGQGGESGKIDVRGATAIRTPDAEVLAARLGEVVARQVQLEKRSAIVAALAREAAHGLDSDRAAMRETPGDALAAIETLGPKSTTDRLAAHPGEADVARAYAPQPIRAVPPMTEPHPPGDAPGALGRRSLPSLANVAANPEIDPAARLDLVGRSLDRIEGGQMTSLAAIDRRAARIASRNAGIIAAAGLDPSKLVGVEPAAHVGGPFIPLAANPDASAFDRATARVGRDVAQAERLTALISFVPLGKPLEGETSVASPFGYRADPFLGRPALHSGVDLLQAYGAEIRAAGAGRVTHAGPDAGYGEMVEIDHGEGLTTRYAHMSEVLVRQGQDVEKGAALGRLGSTGRSTGPHLHYEVRVDGEPVDPERFLRAGARLAEAE
jgi:murein DD-endopeptidase MepM/ murein hydrolase activator NlpD